jgi:hypothetical protein
MELQSQGQPAYPRTLRVKKAERYRLAAVITVVFTACLLTSSSTASTEAAMSARYGVLQNFSHEFGSKFASGYFVREVDRCLITFKIAIKGATDSQSVETVAHIRFDLNPGQVLGLDSEEGQSLNLTCGANAAALTVASGGEDALRAAQKRALSDNDFSEFVIP